VPFCCSLGESEGGKNFLSPGIILLKKTKYQWRKTEGELIDLFISNEYKEI